MRVEGPPCGGRPRIDDLRRADRVGAARAVQVEALGYTAGCNKV